ncbi:Uncharacterized protein DAT39_015696, partial [Clarias magur]
MKVLENKIPRSGVCADDISFIRTEPIFGVCFPPQLLTNSVSLMEFMIRAHLFTLSFFTGLLSFCPLQMAHPPAVHLICLSSEPMHPSAEHTSVRNTGLQ